ncbi:MAG: PKD domain-containing protein, partial [Flavobacteriales bacterium]|nr:PKD domain-containing protein [Flavobacteriales bacterium]
GETTFFTDLSTIDASSSIASWQWDMNDGSSLIGLVDPSHVFADTGVYHVELVVTSAEGCTDTSTQAIHVGPVPSASFTFISACEGSITSFSSTSTIDAGILSYFWDFGDGNTDTGSDPDHTYANDGTYTVTLTVTSDNGCVDVATGSVEIYAAPTALFSASTECEGTATQFTNLSTGSGITDYSWDFGDSNSSILANPSHTYASSGSYTVVLTVTNGDGCVDTHTATVVVNALPNVDFSFSNICEGTSATFANSSSAGSYNWDFGDGNSSTLTSPSHVYNAFGTYDVTLVVTDANFCINSGTQQIEVYDLPDFSLTPTDVACYGEASGSIEVDPLGSPTPTWSYSLNNGTPQISDVFAGIPAGTYDVTVVDGNACEFTLSTSVAQPSDTLGVDVSSLLDIACHGNATGEINVLGTGGTSPYTYSVDAGTPQSSGAFNGLSAGSHDIQIVDANSCVFDTTIVLSEPDTLVLGLVNAEDLLCNGDNSGNLEVSATGGVGPYEYNLDGGLYGMSGSFNGLEAAMYVVGVRDANGCEDTLHVTLTEPGILMLSLLNSEDANCFGESNGSIEVGAASGTPGYQYSLNGVNYVGSGLFEGLGAGTYTVYSKDANGCLDSVTETIFEPALLTIETNSTPVACFGESSGEIEIIATGGTPGPVLGYMFSINGGGSFQPNGGVFTNVASGSYLAVVADTNGCTASEGVVISQPTAAFNLSANVTNALCLDSASGSVQLLASGGTPTYSYSSDNVSFGSGNTFGGFAAGTYMLYGEDVNGCVDSVQVNVGEPATAVHITSILLNNPACPNQASGTATVQVSGGTPGYMYSGNAGNTFQSNQIITGLNGGNHLVVVKDANGCVDTDTITLTSPGIFDITVDTIIGVDCEGDLDGEIHVIAEGGTPSYNYTLNGGLLQSNGDYVNLTDGTYTIAIMDVNGCTYSESFTVSSAQMQPIADFGFSLSGTAVLFNNNSEYGDTYLWEFGDDSTSTVENPVHVYLTDGDYTVTLTVSNECGTDVTTALVSTTTIGITEEEKVTFSLFPNPASSVLNLRSNRSIDSGISMDIISVSGQIVRTVQLPNISSSEVVTLDLSGLSNGLYSLRLTGEKVQSVLRFDIIK